MEPTTKLELIEHLIELHGARPAVREEPMEARLWAGHNGAHLKGRFVGPPHGHGDPAPSCPPPTMVVEP